MSLGKISGKVTGLLELDLRSLGMIIQMVTFAASLPICAS
jgi:hypothetical protein